MILVDSQPQNFIKVNFKKIIRCNIFKSHNWTCRAMEGIDPTEEQIKGGAKGFAEYAKMYCKNCGKESKLNKKLEDKIIK